MRIKNTFAWVLTVCLCFFTIAAPTSAYASTLTAAPAPSIIMTGTKVAAPARYTVAQMKAVADADVLAPSGYNSSWVYKHSVLDSSGNCRIYTSSGVLLVAIFRATHATLSTGNSTTFTAGDGASKTYPYNPGSDALSTERFVYGITYDTPEGIPHGSPLIAWSSSYVTLGTAAPVTKVASSQLPMLLVGQLNDSDVNAPYLFNSSGGPTTITVGAPDTSVVLTVNGKAYTALDLLKKAAVTGNFTYSAAGGSKTDYVEGVSLASLLSGVADTDVVTFTAANGANATSYTMTKAQLVAAHAVLAYGAGTKANLLTPVSAGTGYGPSPTLYLDGKAPIEHIDGVKSAPVKNGGTTGQGGGSETPGKNQAKTTASPANPVITNSSSLPASGDNTTFGLAMPAGLCVIAAMITLIARRRIWSRL
ncbi:MAG: hypothetical protein FWF45_01800 [Coriobacteriia bacterium]|nr:hypothetical protein [Coriobacteriia bacterium]